MNRITGRMLVLAATVVGLAASSNLGRAQATLELVAYTNVWKYFTNGTDLGTNWRAKTYNDAAWPAGRGLLGFESSPAQYTRAPFNTTFVPYPSIITYYFRTHFNFPTGVCGATLVASNYIDDGAVIYLNGTEVARFRMPANPTFNTLANGGPLIEGQDDVATFTPPPGVLVQGDNVVAVEVHQQSASSGDMVWGMNLASVLPSPIAIIEPPPSEIVVEVGQMATLAVAVTGSDLHYQWHKDGARLSGATNSALKILSAQLTNAGRYFVVITNCLSAVTSSVIHLLVVPDTFPPGLVTAVAREVAPRNTIDVTFTERLSCATAGDPANYCLRRAGTPNTVTVFSAQCGAGTVRLTVGGPHWVWGGDYILSVRNVTDPRGNAMSALSNRVAVAFPKEVFPFDGVSRVWDSFGPGFDPTNPPPNWTQLDFPDTDERWFPGPGVLWWDAAPPPSICGGFGDTLFFFGQVASYFRSHFSLPTNSGAGTIRLTLAVGDGAVFYLNGAEIHRFNMPSGPVLPNTFAVTSNVPENCFVAAEIGVNHFRTGDNVLAAEVHRAQSQPAPHVYYGVQITATPRPKPVPAPLLRIRWWCASPPCEPCGVGPCPVEVSWPAEWYPDWVLETAPRVNGPWTVVAGRSPFVVSNPGAVRFFRLRGSGCF